MDMMSALRARLALRHQAISGKATVEKKEESGGIPRLNGDDAEDGPRPAPGSRIKLADVAGAYIAEKRAVNEEAEDWGE